MILIVEDDEKEKEYSKGIVKDNEKEKEWSGWKISKKGYE